MGGEGVGARADPWLGNPQGGRMEFKRPIDPSHYADFLIVQGVHALGVTGRLCTYSSTCDSYELWPANFCAASRPDPGLAVERAKNPTGFKNRGVWPLPASPALQCPTVRCDGSPVHHRP